MSERFSHWNASADMEATYDLDDTSYLTFEDYQRMHDKAKELDRNDDGDWREPDAMSSIRLAALLSADKLMNAVAGASLRTAREILNAPHAEQDMEITRALRRCGIEGEQNVGMCSKHSMKSAAGPAPTRLAVAGLRNVYIHDSYFMPTPEKMLADEKKKVKPMKPQEPERCKQKQFYTPKERYMQFKLAAMQE